MELRPRLLCGSVRADYPRAGRGRLDPNQQFF
jgi:hypothetical protein